MGKVVLVIIPLKWLPLFKPGSYGPKYSSPFTIIFCPPFCSKSAIFEFTSRTDYRLRAIHIFFLIFLIVTYLIEQSRSFYLCKCREIIIINNYWIG